MATSNPNLYKQHRFSKPVPATEEDIALAKPFYNKNCNANNHVGCILIHGFTSTPYSMAYIAKSCSKLCYITTAQVLSGHATSPEDLADTTAEDWINDIDNIYKDLLHECNQIILIGQSLGGAIAAQIASKYKHNTKALFLLSPALNTPMIVKLGRFIAPMAKLLNIHYIKKAIGGDIKKCNQFEITYNKIPLNIFRQLQRCFKAGRRSLSKIHCLTIVFTSPFDHVISYKKTKSSFKKIKSKNKYFIPLLNSYHVISQDNDVDTIIFHIIKTIKRL